LSPLRRVPGLRLLHPARLSSRRRETECSKSVPSQYAPALSHPDRKRLAVDTEARRILSHDARGHETDDSAYFILRQTARARRQPKIAALIRVRHTLRDLACLFIRFAEAGDRIHKSLGTLENIVQFLEMVRRYTDLLIRVCAFLGKLPNDALRQAPNS